MPKLQCTISCRLHHATVSCQGSLDDDRREQFQTRQHKTGESSRLSSRKERLVAILDILPKTRRGDHARLAPASKNSWARRLVRSSGYIIEIRCHLGLFGVIIDKRDRRRTIFNRHLSFSQFVQMTFGLGSSSSTFRRATDVSTALVKWKSTLVYSEDINLIFERWLK